MAMLTTCDVVLRSWSDAGIQGDIFGSFAVYTHGHSTCRDGSRAQCVASLTAHSSEGKEKAPASVCPIVPLVKHVVHEDHWRGRYALHSLRYA